THQSNPQPPTTSRTVSTPNAPPTTYPLSETPPIREKIHGRIFRFSASGTPKTAPASAPRTQGTFWLLFVPAKSHWRVTPQASYFPKPKTRQTPSLPPNNKTNHLSPKTKKDHQTMAFPLNIHKKISKSPQ
ncbi:hypothetical protein, partial [Vibrio fluvialis]|uniref:hypothetical protein n=1 Tax=Vibrio fluvialis TaxID=676 RepID=UPI001EECCD68